MDEVLQPPDAGWSASLFEQLTFAGCLLMIGFPIFASRPRQHSNLPIDPRVSAKALWLASTGLLLLQLAGAVIWYFAAFGSELSFPTAFISLLASLSVCVTLRSQSSAAVDTVPLHFLTATLLYDIDTASRCTALAEQRLANIHCAIFVLKAIMIILSYQMSQHQRSSALSQIAHTFEVLLLGLAQILRPVSIAVQWLLTASSLRVTHIDESDALYIRFRQHWKPDGTAADCSLASACMYTIMSRHIWCTIFESLHVIFCFAFAVFFENVASMIHQPGSSTASVKKTVIFAAVIQLGIVVTKQVTQTLALQIASSTKAMLITAINDKILKLDSETLERESLTSLLSDDIEAVVGRLRGGRGLLRAMLATLLAFALLYRSCGASCLALLIPTPIASFLAYWIVGRQALSIEKYREKVDVRVKAVISVLVQLKNIKMMGLGSVLSRYVARQVDDEIAARLRYRSHDPNMFALGGILLHFNPVIVLASALYVTKSVDADNVAQIFGIYAVVSVVTEFVGTGEFFRSEWQTCRPGQASLERFLRLEELPIVGRNDAHQQGPAFELVNLTVASQDGEIILQDMNLEIKRNRISMVFGQAGCGKTTLLRALLGEVKPTTGSLVDASGSVAYCAQSVWIPALPIRQVIVGDHEYVEHIYRAVLIASCLDAEVMNWPNGDMTWVGQPGFVCTASLKQRLALARAFYAQPSTIIMDDSLSSIDSITRGRIVANLFSPSGIVRQWGGLTIVMVANTYDQLRFADVIFEVRADHEIWEHTDLLNFFTSTTLPNVAEASDDAPEWEDEFLGDALRISEGTFPQLGNPKRLIPNLKTLFYFLRPSGWKRAYTWPFVLLLHVSMIHLPEIFLALICQTRIVLPKHFAIFVVLSFCGVIAIRQNGNMFLLSMTPKIARTFHARLTRTALSATPEFIANADYWAIISIFRDDFLSVSNGLHIPFMQTGWISVATLQIFFSIFYTVRYGFYLAPVSAIAFGVMLWVYVSTMRHLLHVADKAEKLFEAHTASTVAGVEHVRAFSQQAQCLGKTQQIARQLLKCTYSRLQVHLRMQFIFDTWHGCIAVFVIASALLNPHSTSVAMLGLAFVLLIGGAEMPFQIVLAVAATERQLGSISRIRGFCNDTPLEQDVAIQSHPGDSWPYAGHIDLQRATVTAESGAITEGYGLRQATVSIEAGEKVGLGGYPNHGQSSVILAVLRMVDYTGSIKIDGQEVNSIPRDLLRSSITTVTQDGIAICGSVRMNVDPYSITDGRFTDDELIQMLGRVGLWNIVHRRGGLDADIKRMYFSQGQLQLLNLARGALHKRRNGSRIVLIDEATSSLDLETEWKMSDFMDGEFAGATVLIVAERLQCFETADVVLMMKEGMVDSILRLDEDTGEWYEEAGR